MTDLRDRFQQLTAEAPDDRFDPAALMPVARARRTRRRVGVAGGVGVVVAAVVIAGVVIGRPTPAAHDIRPAGRTVQLRFSPSDVRASRAPQLDRRAYTTVYTSPPSAGAGAGAPAVAGFLSHGRALVSRHGGAQWGYVDGRGHRHWWPRLPGGAQASGYAGRLPDGGVVLERFRVPTSTFWILRGNSYRKIRIPMDGHGASGIDGEIDIALGGDRLWLADGSGTERIWSHPLSRHGGWRSEGRAWPLDVSGDHELEMSGDQKIARLRDLDTGAVTTFQPPKGCEFNSGAVGRVVALGMDCNGVGHVVVYDLRGVRLVGVRMEAARLRASGTYVSVSGNGSPDVLIDTTHATVRRSGRVSPAGCTSDGRLITWTRGTGARTRWFVARLDRGAM
ncbi:MAG: hypothetical protein FWE71_04330 [Nocardioidaceae bacterium]|nr:hypothetical protein [Nocardioidaceae bacterium]MCL2612991.1 hypothetical protein [Nocardioidaceae bacterium]